MRYIERLRGVGGKAWKFIPFSRPDHICELESDGRTLARFKGAGLNNFNENDGLFEVWRAHGSADSRTGSIESSALLPFAQNAVVSRKIEFFNGVGMVTVDVRARDIRRLELDELFLPGTWLSVRRFDGKDFIEHDLSAKVEFELPVAALTFSAADGRKFELGCGDDFWRYSAAAAIGGAQAKLSAVPLPDGLKIQRVLIDLPEGMEPPPPRPWRFSWYFAWPVEPTPEPAGTNILACGELAGRPDDCLISAAARKNLRKAVRTATDSTVLSGISTRICSVAAHLGRTSRGELAHWDLPELFGFYPWAARRMTESEGDFRLKFATDAPERRLLAAAALEAALTDDISVLDCKPKG
ncbi:MAG: hypothetical protein AB7F40_06650 [Victivallaceae bacterium]|nr:hypothetical protein [Victivallaceae bacterium]